MSARFAARRRQAARVTEEIERWARRTSEIRAAAIVGSYARGQERMSSDIDVLVLSDAPDEIADSAWFASLHPAAHLVRSGRWGPVHERRFRLRSGLIVELGFAPSTWADVPLDEGTARVLGDGHRILHDDGLLRKAAAALG
ncbi:nucleotidyltransferase domain-containing protein [Frondihabitans cladoniiphilus]